MKPTRAQLAPEAISLIAAVYDAGRDYYRKHPDDMLIAVARHAAALFHGKQHQSAFLQGYIEARTQHEAFKRGE